MIPVETPRGPRIRVEPGDTPFAIARAYVGEPLRWPELTRANPDKNTTASGNFVSLVPGELLFIPASWLEYRKANPFAPPILPSDTDAMGVPDAGAIGTKTALIIGDSHVEPASPFAQKLGALLEAQGFTVTIAGVGSSNARQWATQKIVSRTGRSVVQANLPHGPDLLLISLGTNDAANAAAGGPAVSTVPPEIKQIVSAYAPGSWLWIGPPWMRDNAQFYLNDAMQKLYAAAHGAGVPIFDSRPSTKAIVQAGSGDGIHLGPQGAGLWADAVAKAIGGGLVKILLLAGAVVAGYFAWKKFRR
jgi:lysophospholipase L1-like esterase